MSPILYKRQSDRMFLINQINAFHGNQLLLNSTELLFKKDRYQKDLVIYFTEAEDIPFVVLMKTNRGHVFGGYSEGLCTA